MEWGIIFLVLFTPLAMGTFVPWSYGLMEVIAFILMSYWLFMWVIGEPMAIAGIIRKKNRLIQWIWVWPFVLLLLVLLCQ